MTDCMNEVRSRKEEVVEEQETILLKLDEIVESVVPNLNAATNSKQLIEINKEVLIQFDDVKQQMKLTVSNYTKWSHEKAELIRKSNRDLLKNMKNKQLDSTAIKARFQNDSCNQSIRDSNFEVEHIICCI